VVLCGLLACGGNPPAPVEDRDTQPPPSASYTVKKGDTLYSIAFRYGLDYRKVAVANGIGDSYIIYPGQIIYLDEAVPPAQISTSAAPAPAKTTPPGTIPVTSEAARTTPAIPGKPAGSVPTPTTIHTSNSQSQRSNRRGYLYRRSSRGLAVADEGNCDSRLFRERA
jgi:lipoprotein NlpD